MSNAVIYDFETLSQNPVDGVVVSVAILPFDQDRFFKANEQYTYEELLRKTKVMKFNVADQVRRGRKIQKSTLEWWRQQSEEAQEQLKPDADDHYINDLPEFFKKIAGDNLTVVYTRNNTFDPVYLKSICDQLEVPFPYSWWLTRDTKSLIDGMTWGQADIKDSFIVPGLESLFVAHDPRHDVAMDVMRIQYLSNILCPSDEVPW